MSVINSKSIFALLWLLTGCAHQGEGMLTPSGIPTAPTKPGVVVFAAGSGEQSFATVGLLRALKEWKIPVRSIYGAGFGAMISALYLTARSFDDFEWKISKIPDDLFRDDGFALKRLLTDKKRMNIERLIEAVPNRPIESLKPPLRVLINLPGSEGVVEVTRGPLRSVLRAALADDRYFPRSEWRGRTAVHDSLQPSLWPSRLNERAAFPVVTILPEDTDEGTDDGVSLRISARATEESRSGWSFSGYEASVERKDEIFYVSGIESRKEVSH